MKTNEYNTHFIVVLGLSLKARANARNSVGQQDATLLGPTCCERLHTMLCVVATCWMKFETGQTSSNNFQQVATTRNNTQHSFQIHNMVFKRSQHVGPNNVASCWPTMLRAFARALNIYKLIRNKMIQMCLNIIMSTKDFSGNVGFIDKSWMLYFPSARFRFGVG